MVTTDSGGCRDEEADQGAAYGGRERGGGRGTGEVRGAGPRPVVLSPFRPALLLLAGVVILVAGCTVSGREAPPEPPDPRPLGGAVDFSADQAKALWEAEEAKVRACMRERGHRYLSPGHREGSPAATASPYALLRPAGAESDGYGMSAEYLAGPPADPNEDHLAGLSEEEEQIWRRALLGEEENDHEVLSRGRAVAGYDTQSCVGAARAELYGPEWPDLYYAMAELSHEVIELTRESGGFRGAEALWASCMAERGSPTGRWRIRAGRSGSCCPRGWLRRPPGSGSGNWPARTWNASWKRGFTRRWNVPNKKSNNPSEPKRGWSWNASNKPNGALLNDPMLAESNRIRNGG